MKRSRQDNNYNKIKREENTYNYDRSNTTLNTKNMRCDSTNGQKRETYA